MTIHLPEWREQFVRSLIAGGRFASESDVVEEALGLLEERERQQAEARGPAGPPTADKPIWDVIRDIAATVPDQVWAAVPTDLAEQHDHYLYGTPKRTDR